MILQIKHEGMPNDGISEENTEIIIKIENIGSVYAMRECSGNTLS